MPSNRRALNLWLVCLAADFFAVTAAYYTTFLLRFRSAWGEALFNVVNRSFGFRPSGFIGEEMEDFYIASGFRIVLIVALTLFFLYALCDLYTGRRFIRPRPTAWYVLKANFIALALFYAYFYLRRNVFHPRSFFAMLIVLNVFYTILFRVLADRLLLWLRSKFGIDRHAVLLLGRAPDADFIRGYLERNHPHGLHVEASVEIPADIPFERVLGSVETAVHDHGIHMIVSADKALGINEIMELLEAAERLEVSVKVLSDKMDVLWNQGSIPVDFIQGVPLAHFDAPRTESRLTRLRLGAASVAALAAGVILLPVMGAVALLIKLTSPGPVFFVQERIGVNRRPFRMFKFRTMYDRADELQAQVEEFNESGRGLFKIRRDPRVTPVGRLLRRFSLDEIPQLINVLRGEMTIVGPRPLPRRDFEHYYEDWHYSRHGGLPGLTCLWQVSGRSDIDFHNMCIMDVYYLRNQSWMLDLKIILRTAWGVLFAKGAY